MRILITGSTGQLGRALTSRLRSCGDVTATDRSTLDLAKPDAIPALLDKLRADLIINTAAYTAVDKAEDEPELAMLINAKRRVRWRGGPRETRFRSFISPAIMCSTAKARGRGARTTHPIRFRSMVRQSSRAKLQCRRPAEHSLSCARPGFLTRMAGISSAPLRRLPASVRNCPLSPTKWERQPQLRSLRKPLPAFWRGHAPASPIARRASRRHGAWSMSARPAKQTGMSSRSLSLTAYAAAT